jgi:hypothetical protein
VVNIQKYKGTVHWTNVGDVQWHWGIRLGSRTALLPAAQGVASVAKMSTGREQGIGPLKTTGLASEFEPYSGMFIPAPPLMLAQLRHGGV